MQRFIKTPIFLILGLMFLLITLSNCEGNINPFPFSSQAQEEAISNPTTNNLNVKTFSEELNLGTESLGNNCTYIDSSSGGSPVKIVFCKEGCPGWPECNTIEQ